MGMPILTLQASSEGFFCQCSKGNAVSPPFAAAQVMANLPELYKLEEFAT
ncbi:MULTISPECIES: hypothetical protein [Citrobacter]|jgi:hypothetical protein|nr:MULTISPECIES: hypothetical protein [Citrobacter]MBJ8821751.1 hypothetical protein [Citrobacter braakii]